MTSALPDAPPANRFHAAARRMDRADIVKGTWLRRGASNAPSAEEPRHVAQALGSTARSFEGSSSWLYRRRAGLVALVAAGAMLLPAVAHGSSIVFVKDGNVWLTTPDGGKQHAVTKDGSASDGYESPTQADDGTIVAARGGSSSRLHRMNQNGALLSPPVETAAPGTGPLDPRVSPDGTKVAFSFVTAVGCAFCGPGLTLRKGTLYTYSDRFTEPSAFGLQLSRQHPSWVDNTRALLFSGGAYTHDLGGGDNSSVEWFSDSDFLPPEDSLPYYEGEVTRDGTRIAIGAGTVPTDIANVPSAEILLFTTNGPPPAKPTFRCAIGNPSGSFQNLTWAPDGESLAWAEGDGIWVLQIPSFADCGQLVPRLLVPGGSEPDWGPADINPSPANPEVAPPPTPPQPPNPPVAPPPTAPQTPTLPPPVPAAPHGPSVPGSSATSRPPDQKISSPRRGPILSGVKLAPQSFRAAPARRRTAAARGAVIRYTLDRAATARFRVERERAGRYVPLAGSFRDKGTTGTNSFKFAGWLAGRPLRAGRYRLTAIATDGAAKRSQAARTYFRVLP